MISISTRLERETIIPHLFHSSFQFSTHNSIEIPNIKIKQSRISSRISQSRPISSWRELTTSDNTLKRRVAIKQRTTHSAPVDELHEDHAMASYLGKRRERIFLRRLITNLVWNNMSCNDISRNHSRGIYTVYTYTHTRTYTYIYIYLEFACSTDRGNWCSIFQERGLPVLVFIQQAEQCTGLSAPLPPPSPPFVVPHCCAQDHQQPARYCSLSVALSLRDD